MKYTLIAETNKENFIQKVNTFISKGWKMLGDHKIVVNGREEEGCYFIIWSISMIFEGFKDNEEKTNYYMSGYNYLG